MKTKKSFMKRGAVILSFALLGAVAISSCDKKKDTPANNGMYTISGNGSGSQMVPAVAGNGSSTMTGTYNPTTRVLNYTTNWSNLTGAPTSGGFYTGASGVNGTSFGSPWTFGSDATGTGNVSGTATLTTDQANQLTSGNMYYTMGTAANTGGEVRGQMTATR